MTQSALGIALFLVMLILSAGAACWTVAALKLLAASRWVPPPLSDAAAQLLVILEIRHSGPLIEWSPRRPVPWGLVDVSAVLVVLALPMFAVALANWGALPPVDVKIAQSLSEKQLIVWLDSLIKLGLLLVACPLIAWHTGARWRDFGFSIRELWADLKLGLAGFVMLAPPVYAIQGLLVYFWKPSKHPLMEMFKESPDVGFFVSLFVAAAVVAPLFEELVFRVLLQGFLEKAFSFAGPTRELVFGSSPYRAFEPLVSSEQSADPDIVFLSDRPPQDGNPYAPSAIVGEDVADSTALPVASERELRGLAAWLPITISSVVFALLHYSHGPDWVPLLLLAAGMGYLYQRTHRIVPSLVVHALLNSLSMFGLWLQVFALPEQGG